MGSIKISFRPRTDRTTKKLGFVETIAIDKTPPDQHSMQNFDYLFVLDLEATCWEKSDIHKAPPEIIEFSVVLYHVGLNEIMVDFQQYVMPWENPMLSEFCKSFLGITQEQVDHGVPLHTCLLLFSKWLSEQMRNYNIVFPNSWNNIQQDPNAKKAVFVTWSDWDLKVCLKKECRRKDITKSEVFNMWIDLRALYVEHYDRKPKGLHGALTEVGLNFMGKQHCGLDDARNTALLAGKMISDGILLRITKDIS